MTILDALVLGTVEGITEFLPISSTGHLILASSLLGLEHTEFLKTLQIVIQFGAILAVVALYGKRLLDTELLKRLAVAFLPTGIIGLALYGVVKTYFLGNDAVVLWSLALGGVVLILFERFHTRARNTGDSVSEITYMQACAVGLFQAIAIVPGISRAGATIIGGLVVGLSRSTIVEFSFLLAIPTMTAAAGFDLFKNIGNISTDNMVLLAISFVTSAVVAFVVIRWFISYVRTHDFSLFGYYRIAAAVAFYVLMFR